MKILTSWLRHYLPALAVPDRQLADDLTLRGIAVEGVHDLGPAGGSLLETDITTNRVDAMNHFGIAREAATIYNLPLPPLRADLLSQEPGGTPFPVRVEAPKLCGRFTARVLRGVSIGPSSGQVAHFFSLLGQRQISNAVDASNFTLLGMGHPTHAFDLDKIEGAVIVRLARGGERLRLLDGTERTLADDDLVIADERKALSLAGVMGGWDSMITSETRNVLVEAAWFDPASIRRSSRRHLLHTDASHRFERGADFNAAPLANDLVSASLLRDGGSIDGPMVDLADPAAEARTARRPPVSLSVYEVQRHLGATLDDSDGQSALGPDLVSQYLAALGCTLVPAPAPGSAAASRLLLYARQDTVSQTAFSVTLPSWRLDLERPIDLVEEIARVFGYNRFANTLPTSRPVLSHPLAGASQAVRERMLALGFSEGISSTFASVPDSRLFASLAPGAMGVPMENPLSEDASDLRPSLLPGMLTMLGNNLHRDVLEVRLFEAGEVFAGSGNADAVGDVTESTALSIGLTSATPEGNPLHSAADAPIFELKGTIESLVVLFATPGGPGALSFRTEGVPPWVEPGRGAVALLNNHPFAALGELASAEGARRKLRQPVYLATIDLQHLLELPLRRATAHELSRFQAVERDFSFFFPDSVAWHTVSAAIGTLAIPELREVTPLEIFRDPRGKAVPSGEHSLLLRTVFQSADRTLREEELAAWSSGITAALTGLGGRQRAG